MVIAGGPSVTATGSSNLLCFNGAGDGDRRRDEYLVKGVRVYAVLQRSRRW